MITSLGGVTAAGSELKEEGNSHWGAPNADATNSTGFTARAAGMISSGTSSGIMDMVRFWTTTEFDINDAYYIELNKTDGTVVVGHAPKADSYSVRCMQD
ncbi:MAG: hypothetical protein HC906_11500 [Bacteroidales bacterium]|nr:hypothetical protein [Bacteroidales bacterium]